MKSFNRWGVCCLLTLLVVLLTFGATAAQEATPEATTAADTESVQAAPDAPAAATANNGLVTALWHTHSLARWLVVAVSIAAIVKLGLGLAQNTEFDGLARRLMIAFSAVTTLQWVIGVVFLLVLGSASGTFGVRYWWEHAAIMTVAVGLSHMHNRFKNAPANVRYRNSLILVVVVLALVVVGVALLPQGWRAFPS